MPIYKGSVKQKDIYIGSTKIGKVYKGSKLVFQSGPSAKMYGLTGSMGNQTFDAYLVGSYSMSGIIVCIPSPTAITKITGTLGASGSKVYFIDRDVETSYPYLKTTTVNNIKYYDYGKSGGMSGLVVMEKSKAGSYMLLTLFNSFKPSSVNSTTVVGGGYTYTRNAANDKTWSLTGVK